MVWFALKLESEKRLKSKDGVVNDNLRINFRLARVLGTLGPKKIKTIQEKRKSTILGVTLRLGVKFRRSTTNEFLYRLSCNFKNRI